MYWILLYILYSRVGLGQYGQDDIYFLEKVHEYPQLLDFLAFRYHTWTSRLLAEGALMLVLKYVFWLFPILMATCATLLPLLLVRLATGRPFWALSPTHMYGTFALMQLIPQSVKIPAEYWITGSFVYLLPACLAVVLCIAFRDVLFSQHTRFRYPAFMAAITLVFFNEQWAVAALVFGCVVLVILVGKQRSFVGLPKWLFVVLLLLIFTILFASQAPGNAARMVKETVIWFPLFSTLTFWDKIMNGFRWLVRQWYGEYRMQAFVYLPFITHWFCTKVGVETNWLIGALISAVVASQLLLFASPTIYISGPRVHYVGFVFLNVVALAAFTKEPSRNLQFIMWGIVLFGAFAFVGAIL